MLYIQGQSTELRIWYITSTAPLSSPYARMVHIIGVSTSTLASSWRSKLQARAEFLPSSAAQVYQPLHRKSLLLWRRYLGQ